MRYLENCFVQNYKPKLIATSMKDIGRVIKICTVCVNYK